MTIDIQDLREAGSDGGSLMGYWARGHHDVVEFATAVNAYTGADPVYDRRWVEPKQVAQVWYRTCQMAGEPKGTYEFRITEPGVPGAWKATVCEPLEDYAHKQSRMRQREHDRGYREGLSRALGFLLGQLEWGWGKEGLTDEVRKHVARELRAAYSCAEQELKTKGEIAA